MDPTPREICIFRLSALGDATHVVPVVRALRARWPDARLTWIIGKLEHKLLAGLEGVEFVVFDKRGGWAAVRDLRRRLEGRRFDVLLHMQVAARANLLSLLVRAPVRIGWDTPRSRDAHRWFVNRQVRAVPFQHQVQGFLEFARALDCEVDAPRWDLPVPDKDRDWAARTLGEGAPVLMISPCSSHPRRNWRPAFLAEVARHAMDRLGMRVVLTGGPSELERRSAAEIEAACEGRAMNLVGRDTLKQSVALLERATILITPDSGPAHIASAVGTPVLGLYAATWSRRSGPWRSLDLCVDRFPEAARRYRGSEPESLRWGTRIEEDGVMDLIRPEDVIDRLEAWAEDATRKIEGPSEGPDDSGS